MGVQGAGKAELPRWLRQATLVVGAVLGVALLLLLGSILLPGWWTGVVTRRVDGVFSAGVLAGLLCGAVFTLVPAGLAYLAWRAARLDRRWRLGILGAALVLLLPNVLTLAVSLGLTASSRDARTLMIIGGPGFRGATLAGVLIVVALVAATLVLRWWWRRRGAADRPGPADAAPPAPAG